MAKDILLYGYISSYNAEYFHYQIKDAQKEDAETELVLRVNTEGGSPDYMQSIITKVQSMVEKFSVVGESQMHSAGFFLMCYIPKEKIACIDVTKGVLHRASYPYYIEESADFSGSIYEEVLTRCNKELEKALRARVDVDALEALPQMVEKELKVKDIFRLDAYNEVILSAGDMKKIGLIGSIIQVTPKRTAAVAAITDEFRKCRSLDEFKVAASTKPTKEDQPIKDEIMDLAELKTKYPAIYAEARKEGFKAGLQKGIKKEKDRVEAIMVFAEIDPAGVKAAIEKGEPLSAKQMSEMSLKQMGASLVDKTKKDSTGKVVTDGVTTEATEKEKLLASFDKEVDKHLKIA